MVTVAAAAGSPLKERVFLPPGVVMGVAAIERETKTEEDEIGEVGDINSQDAKTAVEQVPVATGDTNGAGVHSTAVVTATSAALQPRKS
ncbi:hypothetical protein GN244_ATG00142 [Phytophthora infestans]|uniref:Uncharacterized protein n=1 Tax=Phytophthora infestans TaxID=4787 RepID=A0A833WPV5_PHYIN|nr:hypothetical protein GN244_ATG00142 [Phytophthora infestans]KAF4142792.1 hypothetical protein GN958_ATG08020 [Phytophthora infestans]